MLVVTATYDIAHMVDHLHELSLWSDLEYLPSIIPGATSVADNLEFTLQNKDSEDNIVSSFQMSPGTIKNFLSYIGYGKSPFDLMTGALTLVQNLFYPTDDDIHDVQLEYYRQREWRLVEGLRVAGTSQSRLLTEREKETLLNIDERFWSKEIVYNEVRFRRVDDAFVIDKFEGRDVTEMISAIIVPPEAYAEARNLFGEKVQLIEST
jgi:hypothetical protein